MADVCGYTAQVSNSPSPEFGPNGAVMNNPVMGECLRTDYRDEEVPRHRRILRPWEKLVYLLAGPGLLALLWGAAPVVKVWLAILTVGVLGAGWLRQRHRTGRLEGFIWTVATAAGVCLALAALLQS